MAHEIGVPISAPEVRAALERIVASPGFSEAGRLGPFLRFLVETALSGDGQMLKESLIGIEVFGRPAGYDPRTDPIVRVEARRLRSRLTDYYADAGKEEAVRIDLPKGGYIPVFAPTTPAPGAPSPRNKAPARAWGNWYFVLPLLMALLAVFLVPRFWRPHLPEEPPSVAVLPFANVSADAQNEYFSDGLTEELIDTIGQVNGLRVVGRGAVFQYKGKQLDSRQVGKQLNVSHVLEGSVRRSGDQLRISAQLVNASDGYTLWSQTYDRQSKDVFAIQQEIAGAIANALKLQLSVLRGPALARRYTANLDAYNLYLKGRYQWNRYSDEGLKNAVEDFQQAIDADPGYAPAYAMLSSVYALMGYYQVAPPAEMWTKAKAAAEKAISIDTSLAEAHASLGFVLGLLEHRWKDSEVEHKKALELNPASGEVRAAYATSCLLPQGRLDEANAQFRKAVELDPAAVFINYAYGFSLLSSGRIDDAVRQYARALELNSSTPDIWWDYAMALAYAGRKDEAMQAWQKRAEIARIRDWRLGAMENGLLGNLELARKQEAEWQAKHDGERVKRPTDLVRSCATIGWKERALEWLGRSFDQGDPQIVWMKIDLRTRSLRGDPQFEAYMKRLGL